VAIDVFGGGSQLESMRRRALSELVGTRIKLVFHGYESDIETRIANAHLLLHFGREEACPLALIEAQRQGLPVVTYGNGGNVELVPPSNGVLVDEGDFDAAAAAVERFADDRTALIKSSEACRAFSEQLGLDGNARKIDSLYREVWERFNAQGTKREAPQNEASDESLFS
jgi:glycosyltransferase involved in cell wall biosynthesis